MNKKEILISKIDAMYEAIERQKRIADQRKKEEEIEVLEDNQEEDNIHSK